MAALAWRRYHRQRQRQRVPIRALMCLKAAVHPRHKVGMGGGHEASRHGEAVPSIDMSYKTILVHVDEATNAAARYDIAAALALAEQGHLIGLASSGVARFLRDTVAMDFSSPSLAPYLDTLNQRAGHALDAFEKAGVRVGLGAIERRQVEDEPAEALASLARYCDLCIVGQFDERGPVSAVGPSLAADVAAASGTPVLIVPNTGLTSAPMRRVLLAWNASRESARAMHYALPLLQRAEKVDVAILGARATEASPDLRPVTAIGQALARHGIHTEVVQRDTDEDAGVALLALAAERGAELLVMGCYGHSRVRELLLGGATRTVLNAMELPVLMAS